MFPSEGQELDHAELVTALSSEPSKSLLDGPCAEELISVLGAPANLPLCSRALAQSLTVTVFPHVHTTPRLQRFVSALLDSLAREGVTVLPFEESLNPRGRVRDGVAIIVPGETDHDCLAVEAATSFRDNTLLTLVDQEWNIETSCRPIQSRLDTLVQTLTWNVCHMVAFVGDSRWVLGTMNGALVSQAWNSHQALDTRTDLIPKLAAPVIPPRANDFSVREGAFVPNAELSAIRDLVESGPLWSQTGLFLYHTRFESLTYRDKRHRRMISAILDQRTGMSYGFLVRQLPTAIPSLYLDHGFCEHGSLTVTLNGKKWRWNPPPVWILATRSGCRKNALNPHRDIVRMGFEGGKILFDTPPGMDVGTDCKPSFDSKVMLALAIGNVFIASVLRHVRGSTAFDRNLERNGLALAHWHGMVEHDELPVGFHMSGEKNPPVSCSTSQSAVLALQSKWECVAHCLASGTEYLGDVHVEPHHGVNVTGFSLTELALRWLQREEGVR